MHVKSLNYNARKDWPIFPFPKAISENSTDFSLSRQPDTGMNNGFVFAIKHRQNALGTLPNCHRQHGAEQLKHNEGKWFIWKLEVVCKI